MTSRKIRNCSSKWEIKIYHHLAADNLIFVPRHKCRMSVVLKQALTHANGLDKALLQHVLTVRSIVHVQLNHPAAQP